MPSPKVLSALMKIEKRWWRTEEQLRQLIIDLIKAWEEQENPPCPPKAEKAKPAKKTKKKESASVKSSE